MCLDTLQIMRIKFGVLFLLAQWVACSDAWFWFRTGTTTLAPAVEQEGSGSPAGSGELPSESKASVGAEIIDEELGIYKTEQTWAETTKAPELTSAIPSVQPESEYASEKTTQRISSDTIKHGNGTSSSKGMGSGESNHLSFIGRLRSRTESESDSGSGLLLSSESDFVSGTEKSFESGTEAVSPIYHVGLDGEANEEFPNNEQKQKFQEKTSPSRADEGDNLRSTTLEPSLDSPPKRPNNNPDSTHSRSSRYDLNLRSEDLITLKLDNFAPVAAVSQSNQRLKETRIYSEDVFLKMLKIDQVPFPDNTLSIPETPTQTQKLFITQPKTHSIRPDSNSLPTETKLLQTSSETLLRQKASAGKTVAMLDDIPPLLSQTPLSTHTTTKKHTEAKSKLVFESSQCLMIDTALPFCSSMVGESFAVPNYLNQSSVEEVRALLNEWAWLLRSHCHHSLEHFFCLLLVPQCGSMVPPPVLPCQSFCRVLQDSCWTLLDEGHLPVECQTLPDEEDEGCQCLSVSNQKGNHWFKMNPNLGSF